MDNRLTDPALPHWLSEQCRVWLSSRSKAVYILRENRLSRAYDQLSDLFGRLGSPVTGSYLSTLMEVAADQPSSYASSAQP